MPLTYVDAGVLIAAARGVDEVADAALQALTSPDRSFASSAYVRLEVLPKAVYHRQQAEVDLYEWFFQQVEVWAAPTNDLIAAAHCEACAQGLSAIDALHAAAAGAVGAAELLTTERPGKPLHRTTLVPVVTIRPTSQDGG